MILPMPAELAEVDPGRFPRWFETDLPPVVSFLIVMFAVSVPFLLIGWNLTSRFSFVLLLSTFFLAGVWVWRIVSQE